MRGTNLKSSQDRFVAKLQQRIKWVYTGFRAAYVLNRGWICLRDDPGLLNNYPVSDKNGKALSSKNFLYFLFLYWLLLSSLEQMVQYISFHI